MAELGDIQVNQQGQIAKLGLNGWQPISEEQAQSETEPAGVRFGKGFIGLETEGEAGALGNIAGLGSIFAGPLTTGARGLGRLGSRAIASRVERKVAANTAQRAQTAAPTEGSFLRTPTGLFQRPSNALGRSTLAGQASRFVEAGLDAVPGPNLLGLAQRAVNSRQTNAAYAKGLGLSDDLVAKAYQSGIDDTIMDAGLVHWDTGFRKFEKALDQAGGKGLDQVRTRTLFDAINQSPTPIGGAAEVVEQAGKITGKQVKDLRSKLTDLSRTNLDGFQREQVKAQIEAVDDLIEATLKQGDEALIQQYRELRAQYRLWISGQKGQSISPDGMINAASMNTALKNNYGNQYRAGRPIGGTDDINAFLDIAREGAALGVGLPSSGTAERLIGVSAAGALGAAVFGD